MRSRQQWGGLEESCRLSLCWSSAESGHGGGLNKRCEGCKLFIRPPVKLKELDRYTEKTKEMIS